MSRIPSSTHRRWTNRDVSHEVDHHGRRWLWGIVLGVVVASIPAAMWQLEQNECLRLSYEATELRARQERLVEQTRRLRVRREALGTLDSIESWARRNGMIHPSSEQVVVVGDTPPASGDWLARNADDAEREN